MAHGSRVWGAIVDSTGLSIVGEAEWAAAKDGGRGPRGSTTQVTFTATDASGNAVSQAFTVKVLTPAESITSLIDDVSDINLTAGIGNSLDGKLSAALGALDDLNENNDTAAINALMKGFINSIEAQRGKKLTDAQADSLVAAAQKIISAFGG